LLSAPHDDPCTEVVGSGVLHGMPGERVHCTTIEEDEFSVQVMTSLKDDYDLQCPIEDEDVLAMSQAVGWIIRWPASDLRRAEVEGATAAVGAGDETPPETPDQRGATTRAGTKKLKSPLKENIAQSPLKEKKAQSKRAKTKEDAGNTRKRVAFAEATEVRDPSRFPSINM
jgi:hypothetical protein